MDLTTFGWNNFFSANFSEYAKKGFLPARISREHTHIYFLYSESGELTAEVSGRIRHTSDSKCEYPAVGDWVAVNPRPGEELATIHAVLPRSSSFSRKVAGINIQEQVIAANIDLVFIVNGLDSNFNPRRIERYLAHIHDSGAEPVIVLNKTDLCDDVESRISEVKRIAHQTPVIAICALDEKGIQPLKKFVEKGKTIALLGSSGVGKSQIINTLIGWDKQTVCEVRNDSKGRHTTTNRELILLPCGGLVIDTPGIREIQVWCDVDGLNKAFADVVECSAHCRFSDCSHEVEPGCAVQKAIEEGKLDSARVQSYIKMKKEISELEKLQNRRIKITERTKWKKLKNKTQSAEKNFHD
ncbi:MAG: ribosome small subunit-dependent GTPase A [Chlamydiae bacterium]|nr:MAG: ribosome small subunit-dependent GTPase A [Chlamydiota bacterium]